MAEQRPAAVRVLHRFALGIPYLFLKKIPYAWLFAVALWSAPPLVSGVLLLAVLLGIGLMLLQQRAWEAEVASGYRVLHRDEPRAPLGFQVRNALLVLAASLLVGWLVRGRFGLTFLQWTLLLAGVMVLYRDALLFGARTVYLVTNQGIAVRFVPGHVDYRLFLRYDEMRAIERHDAAARPAPTWSLLMPRRQAAVRGLLLLPRKLEGFTRQIEEAFLSPADPEAFIRKLPPSVSVRPGSRPR